MKGGQGEGGDNFIVMRKKTIKLPKRESIIRNKQKDGWLVIPSFNIVAAVNPANLQMLSYINSFFGGKGHVTISRNVYQLRFWVIKIV